MTTDHDDLPLKRSLFHAIERIMDETLGGIDIEHMRLMADDETLAKIEALPEIQDYRKASCYFTALTMSLYGLPIQRTWIEAQSANGTARSQMAIRGLFLQAHNPGRDDLPAFLVSIPIHAAEARNRPPRRPSPTPSGPPPPVPKHPSASNAVEQGTFRTSRSAGSVEEAGRPSDEMVR